MINSDEFWNELDSYTKDMIEAIADLSARRYIILCNVRTRQCWWSESAARFFNHDDFYFTAEQTKTLATIHPDDFGNFLGFISTIIRGKGTDAVIEFRAKPNNASEYNFFSMKGRVISSKDGKPHFALLMLHNYGIREEIDEITGLHNEISFSRRIAEKIDDNIGNVILKVAIEKFSHINVMYGAEYANKLIREVAENIARLTGDDGTVYRLSGVKFGICLRPMSRTDLKSFYRKLVDLLADKIFVEGKKVPLKISAGAIILDNFMKDAVAVRSRITYALNHSKQYHHGDLVIFNDEVCGGIADNLDLISTIHQCALNGCEGFYMCYQPIVNPKDGRIKGMEALVRWRRDPYGNIPPGTFIEWLEEDPCIFELGNWILRRSLEDAKEIASEDPEFFINVNISAAQIERHEFRESVTQILEESGLNPKQLCMELTERCRELDTKFLREEINFFKSKGIKLAMDDFGTGNASLSVALNLPIDELKIDMSFVKDIKNKPVNQAMVKSIVEFANTTNLETCIEGVEDDSVKEYLGQFDATWHQGYFYSRPVPIQEFKELYYLSNRN